jgi:hypothetical protein
MGAEGIFMGVGIETLQNNKVTLPCCNYFCGQFNAHPPLLMKFENIALLLASVPGTALAFGQFIPNPSFEEPAAPAGEAFILERAVRERARRRQPKTIESLKANDLSIRANTT